MTDASSSKRKVLGTTIPHEILDLDDLLLEFWGSLSGVKNIIVFGRDSITPIGKICVFFSILRSFLDLLLVGLELLHRSAFVFGDVCAFEDLESSEVNLVYKGNKARL